MSDKVKDIIEQCNDLLEDETYDLPTIELTKDEIKSLLNEIEELECEIDDLNDEIDDLEFREVIEDIEEFKWQLKLDGLWNEKLDDFIDHYLKYHNK